MPATAPAIDKACASLRAAGWKAGDLAETDEKGRRVWHVYAHRRKQTFLARAPTRDEAWIDALQRAKLFDDERASSRLPK